MLNERKKNINYNDLKGINQKSQCFEVIKLIDASEIEAIWTTKVLPTVPTIATRTYNKNTVTFEQPKISILVSFFSFIDGSLSSFLFLYPLLGISFS